MEIALDAGADDISTQGENFEVICSPESYSNISQSLEEAGLECTSKQVTRIPQNTVDLDIDMARQVLKLMETLDDHDDVQGVSANFNISDEAMAELANE